MSVKRAQISPVQPRSFSVDPFVYPVTLKLLYLIIIESRFRFFFDYKPSQRTKLFYTAVFSVEHGYSPVVDLPILTQLEIGPFSNGIVVHSCSENRNLLLLNLSNFELF